jgi:hypothetical protein
MTYLRNLIIIASLAVSLLPVADLQAQTGGDEYRAKAAFLRSFGRFVVWPAVSLPPGTPLVIGLVGHDDFGRVLEDAVRGKLASGHPIHLRHFVWGESLAGCHIVFVSSSELVHLPAILKPISTKNVLTVSDLGGFAHLGGMIELAVVGNRVQFDINWENALHAGLKVDSKLLSAARQVFVNYSDATP